MRRCPDIRFVLAHAGGAAPYLAWRLEQTGKRLPQMEEAPEGVIAALQAKSVFRYGRRTEGSPAPSTSPLPACRNAISISSGEPLGSTPTP